jgi:manganese oxidase
MRRIRYGIAISLTLSAAGAGAAQAQGIPTGAPPSPLFGALPFSQEMLLFEEFGTKPVPGSTCPTCIALPAPATCDNSPDSIALDNFLKQPLWPAATRAANTTLPNPWAATIGTCVKPLAKSAIEGRPSGEWFAHQRWPEFAPKAYFQSAQAGARVNGGLRDTLQRHRFAVGEFRPGGLNYRGGTNKSTQVRFHPLMPVQNQNSVWTFDGTMPPKLLMVRYGEPVLFRHYNALPVNVAANNGFGLHTITTHEHNGHNPAESDGYTAAFFFPGQYYDYRWPMILAGYDTINTSATDPRAGMPNGAGGTTLIRGDWRETMSTHWFHDHMLDFTAQNVYKGNAAMMNYYSAVDRGREGFQCHYANSANANLCLPSGTALDWGNRDYDVNLLIADKAWDANGQLFFNIFNRDGFLGDRILVNWSYKPYLNVRARRYRFRLLNGSVSRYFKIAVVTDAGARVPFHMVANDGNIMQHAVPFPNAQSQDMPQQAIAERYDIVVDFKGFAPGTKIYFVNLLEHRDGAGPSAEIPLANVLNGTYAGDPGVGKFLEFRVVAYSGADLSMNPVDYEAGKKVMIPVPTFTAAELAGARHRTFEFGKANGTDDKPWTIKTDGGLGRAMDPHRISAAPTKGSVEIWHLLGGTGWAHPVHIHFEEGKILSRGGAAPPIWETFARKDVFRLSTFADSTNSVDVAMRVREFMGSFVEHCHNTQHEDHAMLLRWDLKNPGSSIAIPTPVQTWEGTFYEPSFGGP